MASNLPKYVLPAAIDQGLSTSAAVQLLEAIATGNQSMISDIPGITPGIISAATAAAHTAYFKSFQVVYYTSIAFGLCAVLASLLVKGELLEEAMSDRIARKMQGVEAQRSSPAKQA